MISATIIKDSVAPSGVRLTTFVLTYPRFIHCFDEETEVLANINGYKRFIKWKDAIKNHYPLAAYNKDTEEVAFETPSAYIEKDVEEELVKIESNRISMLVTKGHRLLVGSRKSYGDKWEVIKAEDMLNDHTTKRFKTFGFYNGGEKLGDIAKIIGFFVGDGTQPRAGYQSIFRLKKERKINYIKDLLNKNNIPFDEHKYKDGAVNIVVPKSHRYLFDDCYDENRIKKIPKSIHSGDRESFLGFLDGLWNSDGSTDREYLKVFNTTSDSVASDLSALASIHGLRINLTNSYANHVYKLNNCKEVSAIIRKDKHPAEVVSYSGKVYCATVSTGFLIVRRKGLVHISGNCELMTHRVLSRNASSSRAIPVKKQIQMVIDDPAIPISFLKNKPGMQGGERLTGEEHDQALKEWLKARDAAVLAAESFVRLGVSKQYANRVLEPFAHITVVCTANDYNNFFALRYHPDAQPEFGQLAKQMWEAYTASEPKTLKQGDWHLPFINETEPFESQTQMIKCSVARCARVSYLNHNGNAPTLEEDMKLYDRLVGSNPKHASPTEHQAMAMTGENFKSGNFRGWLQYRQTIPGQNILEFQPPTDLTLG